MQNALRKFAVAWAAFHAIAACQAQNPIVQTIYTADPAPMVYGDTVYLYTGHDEDKSTWFTMKDWHCYSSNDMVNWTDHGSPLSVKDFIWAKADAWAGQCIERDGRFYYYVPMTQRTGGMAIGVAVSASPTGPFKDALGHPLVFDRFGDIDPTVFIDSDGQAYLYWGNPVLKYVKLNKDMISFDTTIGDKGVVRFPMTPGAFGKRSRNDRPSAYEEGPWFYKRNGLYYLAYAAGPVPEHLAYATSSNPTGPWTYRDVIMPVQGGSFTNQLGIIDFKGHSYMFYHNAGLPGGGGFTRSVCVEEFKYGNDGSIPRMNMVPGSPGALQNLDPYIRHEASTIAWESGVRTEPYGEGGLDVYPTQAGAFIKVRGVDFGAQGAARFTALLSLGTGSGVGRGGSIELHLDTLNGPLVGAVPASDTGGGWKQETVPVKGVAGIHDLFFVFQGGRSDGSLKFKWWQFGRD